MEKYQELRLSEHLIVLDANVLLELYRQPANISLDIIDALKKIQNNIYIPRQVFDEYIKHHHKICGSEKKKYNKVTRELSDFLQNLQEDIAKKISDYRKHNYTDISKLQNDLNEKIKDARNIIADFEKSHSAEIQLNIDFLQNDKVKAFVDLLESQGCVGEKISFSQKLSILQEGQVRFDNLIPPGFRDSAKDGKDKYGDLFIWKSIIAIAKEKNCNIIFVCNDTKEDWWEKENENPIDLRQELNEEFKEINPVLQINFLTLDKFFSYLAEELKLGKSKSALQLSAIDDVKEILDDYEEDIYQNIGQYLCTLDIGKELDEDFLESDDENIYWNVTDVSVEKEDKKIVYYVNLDISLLADLIYQEEGDYPYDAGKIALALIGHIEIIMEEYSAVSEIRTINIEKGDILHIEPEVWHIVKDMENKKSCKDIIAASKNIISIHDTAKKIHDSVNIDGLKEALQQYATIYEHLAESIKPIQINGAMNEVAKQLSINLKALESIAKPNQVNAALTEFAKQFSTATKAMDAIRPVQINLPMKELAKQASIVSKAIQSNSTNEQE